jgi:hypothetical protein
MASRQCAFSLRVCPEPEAPKRGEWGAVVIAGKNHQGPALTYFEFPSDEIGAKLTPKFELSN